MVRVVLNRGVMEMSGKYLYQTIVDKIAELVDNGTYKPGDRVPSIRELSRQSGVSINTVKVAYEHLEDCCLIEARPQSGYYVSARLPEIPREPEIDETNIIPSQASSCSLVVRIMKDVLVPDKVQFGAAIPDPDLIPGDKLSRILASETRRLKIESTAYAMPPGHHRLRQQIAKWMTKAGCVLNPEKLVVTSGASEAVFLALRAICRPGDTVAISSPIYFNFVQMFEILGLRVIEIPNSPVEGLQIEHLRHALAHNNITCCIAISNFDNPMGNRLSDARKEELVSLLWEAKVPLIEDDINGDLAHDGERPTVAKAWDRHDNVLLCSSFSKTLAPGYRVGWIAPGRFMDAVLHQKIVSNIATASPTQLAIAEFLENGGYAHHLRTICKAYAAKVARMAEAIGTYFPQGTRVTRPEGGFTLWLELAENIDTVALYAMAAQKKITIAPGSLFSTGERYHNCLRLNSACYSEETKWAVEALGEMVHELANSQDNHVKH